ncbi:hypothetical protein RF679_17525 [Undibacterium cyanobacteriorum]|uniref:Uncharacterized protein n=1 Tax=Undibacterium cyanobacteriorum TaxID=3073561 RepID=A0ABY9RIC2_9BURK|nr:hypothetical protein [Undibacterium sp. 20NA77.5]WMW80424.1 hypothetical protein RF679_17525 [Undibacterium sp. 20NA77.5]
MPVSAPVQTQAVNNSHHVSLDQQLASFRQRRFLAMPLAGCLVWFALIFFGLFATPQTQVLATFVGTGSIVYLAMGLAKLTGERLKFQAKQQRNFFDTVLLSTVGMSFLVYAIALPFFMQNYRALPFAVAVLTGIMWLPMGVLMQHWVGYFHAIARTVLCTLAWLVAPEHSFVLQPVIVVTIYLVSIFALELRWKRMNTQQTEASLDHVVLA